MSSLSSVRKPKAWEFIVASPAILVRAGSVPFSEGPLGPRPSARTVLPTARLAARARMQNFEFIRRLLRIDTLALSTLLTHGRIGGFATASWRNLRDNSRENSHLTGSNARAGIALPAIDGLLNWLSEPKNSNVLPLGLVSRAVAACGGRGGAPYGAASQAQSSFRRQGCARG